MKQLSDGRYVIAPQLLRSHIYFYDVINGYYDATLLLEIFRQVSICITHRFYTIPHSTKFIFNKAEFNILNDTFLNNIRIPIEVTIKVNVVDKKRKTVSIIGLNLDMSIYVDNCLCVIKSRDSTWMSDLVCKKLRNKPLISQNLQENKIENQILCSVKPPEVGHTFHRNVVIKELKDNFNEIITSLYIEQSYPGLFDHELDHVLGMVLIEMLKQTALIGIKKLLNIYAHRLELIECYVIFFAFCEIKTKTEYSLNKSGLKKELLLNKDKIIKVHLSILQSNKVITSGSLMFKHVSLIN